MVVKWSVCLPSTPTIRVQTPLAPAVISVIFVIEQNGNKQKEALLKNNVLRSPANVV